MVNLSAWRSSPPFSVVKICYSGKTGRSTQEPLTEMINLPMSIVIPGNQSCLSTPLVIRQWHICLQSMTEMNSSMSEKEAEGLDEAQQTFRPSLSSESSDQPARAVGPNVTTSGVSCEFGLLSFPCVLGRINLAYWVSYLWTTVLPLWKVWPDVRVDVSSSFGLLSFCFTFQLHIYYHFWKYSPLLCFHVFSPTLIFLDSCI